MASLKNTTITGTTAVMTGTTAASTFFECNNGYVYVKGVGTYTGTNKVPGTNDLASVIRQGSGGENVFEAGTGDHSVQQKNAQADASGDYSFAFGREAVANDGNAFAFGFQATSNGNNSISFGHQANAFGIKIIDATSNSNPDGAKMALETLALFDGRKIELSKNECRS